MAKVLRRINHLSSRGWHFFAGLLVAPFLFACSQSPAIETDSSTRVAGDFAALSTVDPRFKPRVGATVAWYSDIIVSDELSDIKVSDEASGRLKQLLQQKISARGYQFVNDQAVADYIVGAAVVLDESEASKNIKALVGVDPGLSASLYHNQEGSIVLAMALPGLEGQDALMWRGTIQAYVLGEKLSEEERWQRLNLFTDRLVLSLPQASN